MVGQAGDLVGGEATEWVAERDQDEAQGGKRSGSCGRYVSTRDMPRLQLMTNAFGADTNTPMLGRDPSVKPYREGSRHSFITQPITKR